MCYFHGTGVDESDALAKQWLSTVRAPCISHVVLHPCLPARSGVVVFFSWWVHTFPRLTWRCSGAVLLGCSGNQAAENTQASAEAEAAGAKQYTLGQEALCAMAFLCLNDEETSNSQRAILGAMWFGQAANAGSAWGAYQLGLM